MISLPTSDKALQDKTNAEEGEGNQEESVRKQKKKIHFIAYRATSS